MHFVLVQYYACQYLILIDLYLMDGLKQTMLIWERPVGSITECAASALSIQASLCSFFAMPDSLFPFCHVSLCYCPLSVNLQAIKTSPRPFLVTSDFELEVSVVLVL